MNVDRLQALSTELRRRNPMLYMGSWRHCACGFAATMPEFNLLGFKIELGAPSYQGHPATESVMSFFDLRLVEVIHLFSERMGFVEGKEIAKLIDDFIVSGGKVAAESRVVSAMAQVENTFRSISRAIAELATNSLRLREVPTTTRTRERDELADYARDYALLNEQPWANDRRLFGEPSLYSYSFAVASGDHNRQRETVQT